MTAQTRGNRFAGSILIADTTGILLCENYNAGSGQPRVGAKVSTAESDQCRANAKYPLGSIAKQFTAASILQLEAQGKLQIKDQACKYIINCPATWRGITILDLLTQTDGLPELRTSTNDQHARPATNPSQVLKLLRETSPQQGPGQTFREGYSGYALLDEIVQSVSHEPYEECLQGHLFRPLKMRDTGYCSPSQLIKGRTESSITPDDLAQSLPYVEGGICSTVEDLFKWDRALYTQTLLPKEALDAMFHPAIEGQGLGWTINREFDRVAESQESGLSFLSASIRRYPESHSLVIVLSNGGNVDAATISHDLAALLFGKHYELPHEHRRAVVSTDTMDSYVGRYVLADRLVLQVFRKGRMLMIQTRGEKPVELIPESETRFFVNDIDSEISFIRGTNGVASELVLQQGGRDVPAERVP